ncbi:hypothetical protein EDD37DRAFT_691507 [Exophiala viscosa]|uniref:GST N-terminal domain-containing protein n=1 Tax=Exophiala viscosa TaxID=2486360 RepID=A0AAN6E4Y4_9EURO|nr:hypothetical protein EDD36DRAFT_413656 [Exophiala viscosa]KAI1627082.1 hypothetical protein EDD37DRAFT_691507 [Exophiala viscosa]
MLTIISATPSPYARMNRIALLEKGIPFELKNEIPWHESETQTPLYNPLEKLPILLFDDGREPVYDSAQIQEYIVQKFADKSPRLVTGDVDNGPQSEADPDIMKRDEDKQSKSWLNRQNRKIDGALKAMNELAKSRKEGSDYLLADVMTIADIAVICAVGQVDFGGVRPGWQDKYPELAAYWKSLDATKNFADTKPVMFDLKHNTVV